MKTPSKKQLITISVIAIIVLIVAYFVTTMGPSYIKGYQKTIDSAQHNIDSLKIELEKSNKMIDSMGYELMMEDRENARLKEQIIDIKKKNNEKLNSIDKLNNAELQYFFTDRYDVN